MQGYYYALFVPQPQGGPTIRMSPSAAPLKDPVSAVIALPANDGSAADDTWTLSLAPAAGWVPAWRAPLLALVVVVSFMLGLLLLGLMVNRQQQIWLLKQLKVRMPCQNGVHGAGPQCFVD